MSTFGGLTRWRVLSETAPLIGSPSESIINIGGRAISCWKITTTIAMLIMYRA